jgi:hypothetical protein
MRPTRVTRLAASAAFALIVSACNAPGGAALAPGSAASAPETLVAHAPACPMPGTVLRRGKGTAKIVLARTKAGGPSITVEWTIVMTNLTESESYPRYDYKALAFCGSGMKPRGSIGGGGSYSHKKTCNNGSCTVTETIGIPYLPPARLVRNVFKYDMIRFAPNPPMAGYAAAIGALVQVNQ